MPSMPRRSIAPPSRRVEIRRPDCGGGRAGSQERYAKRIRRSSSICGQRWGDHSPEYSVRNGPYDWWCWASFLEYADVTADLAANVRLAGQLARNPGAAFSTAPLGNGC